MQSTQNITEPPFCKFSLFLFSSSFLILTYPRNDQDLGEMTLSLPFHLEKFCSWFVVIACRRFWTDLFAICCGNAPGFQIQSPITQSTAQGNVDKRRSRSHSPETPTRPKRDVCLKRRLKLLKVLQVLFIALKVTSERVKEVRRLRQN